MSIEFPRFVIANKRTEDWQTHPEGSIAFGDRSTLLTIAKKFVKEAGKNDKPTFPLAKELHLDEKRGEVINNILLIPLCANLYVALAPHWEDETAPKTTKVAHQSVMDDL